ncbi:MAG: hypothetical protein E7000_08830 [Coriobacteriaceae bacterium]|nr:hypothetical protein [Coriobacteriaceae bacterium]
MFWTFLGLLAVLLVVRGTWYAISRFWAWLARGKRLHNEVESGKLSAEVALVVANADRARLMKEVAAADRLPSSVIRLSREQRKEVMRVQAAEREEFLANLRITWYQVVMIFFVASILGLVLEEVWMFITAGLTESRVGLIWGPYSPLYGVGALLFTFICFALRRHGAPWWGSFLVCAIIGGLLEQIVGWGMETFMGAVSWDYTNVPGAITKWVALPFLFFWGLLGVVWDRLIMPDLLFRIGVPTTRRQVLFVGLLGAYLAMDIFMTLAVFDRVHERELGIPPETMLEEYVDENYTQEFVEQRFENMDFG